MMNLSTNNDIVISQNTILSMTVPNIVYVTFFFHTVDMVENSQLIS